MLYPYPQNGDRFVTIDSVTSLYLMYRERKCADTIGTVLVPWADQFQR